MSQGGTVLPSVADTASSQRRLSWVENRFLPPAFITAILLAGHLSFGILESYKKRSSPFWSPCWPRWRWVG